MSLVMRNQDKHQIVGNDDWTNRSINNAMRFG